MATGIFDSTDFFTAQAPDSVATGNFRHVNRWGPDSFAREQVRGLVRQVFFSSIARPVRQVIFTAVDSRTDVGSVCRQVGRALTLETKASVAVVCDGSEDPESSRRSVPTVGSRMQETGTRLHDLASKAAGNLWVVPWDCFFSQTSSDCTSTDDSSCGRLPLAELRSEFDYSIVQGPAAGESSEAAALGQIADGVILVVAADRTRRATARKTVDTLRAAQVHLLGTVLSDRTFPIPEAIYRRL